MICPYCGEEWVCATSNTTGCCDTERVVRGYAPLPKEEAVVIIEYPHFYSEEARREMIVERATPRDVDWFNPPPQHCFMAIECQCGLLTRFHSVNDVPLQDYRCLNCQKLLLHWEETS